MIHSLVLVQLKFQMMIYHFKKNATMTYEEERKELIQKDRVFVSLPPPTYSKMTNEQIKQRTEMFKAMFDDAFDDDSEDEDL